MLPVTNLSEVYVILSVEKLCLSWHSKSLTKSDYRNPGSRAIELEMKLHAQNFVSISE